MLLWLLFRPTGAGSFAAVALAIMRVCSAGFGVMRAVVIVVVIVVVTGTLQGFLASGRAEGFEETLAELIEEEEIDGEVGGRIDDQQQIGEFANSFHEVARVHVFGTCHNRGKLDASTLQFVCSLYLSIQQGLQFCPFKFSEL